MAAGEQITHILKSYVLKSFTIGFAVLLVILVVWLVRGYQKGTYWNAKRARSGGDVERAVALFKEAVREDTRLSFKALRALMEMNQPYALKGLIELTDLPDLNWIVAKNRERMCDVIRRRTVGTTADRLPLDPYAPQDIRANQKRQWKEWFSTAKEQYDWKEGRFVPKQSHTHSTTHE